MKKPENLMELGREELISTIAELDSIRWGIAEHESSSLRCRGKSIGLLRNELLHRPEFGYGDAFSDAIRDDVEKSLTTDDRHFLRQGG
jgi:hypothetical protein